MAGGSSGRSSVFFFFLLYIIFLNIYTYMFIVVVFHFCLIRFSWICFSSGFVGFIRFY